MPKGEAPKGATVSDRRNLYDDGRRSEGIELLRRYEANAEPPFRFTETEATCHKRQSFEPTDFDNNKVRNQMGKDLRAYFRRKSGKKVVVIIRAIDGLTVEKNTMRKFCTMIESFRVRAKLVIQYNKVFKEIRPYGLENYKGLGGIVCFKPRHFLSHVNGTKRTTKIRKILKIWNWLGSSKVRGQGIQDRNSLLPANAMAPLDGTMGSSV